MTDRQRLETTYTDLRPDDQIEDKAGNRWLIADLSTDKATGRRFFWLCDLATNIKLHMMQKEEADPVTVWRLPKHADQVAQLEADFDDNRIATLMEPELVAPIVQVYTAEEAIEAVAETLGATVDLKVEAAEIDAAIVAEDTGIPVELPAFEDMTDLEKRTHLYVLHGIWATDMQSRAQLADSHDQAHNGKVNAKLIPHTHNPKAEK